MTCRGNVTTLNIISTVGSWIQALAILVFMWNVYITWRFGKKVTEDDPWGYCSSLEWATPCPAPRHNFYRIPRIRSERPAFDLHYPHIITGARSRGIEQTIPATPPTAARLFGTGSGEPGRSVNERPARSAGDGTERQ